MSEKLRKLSAIGTACLMLSKQTAMMPENIVVYADETPTVTVDGIMYEIIFDSLKYTDPYDDPNCDYWVISYTDDIGSTVSIPDNINGHAATKIVRYFYSSLSKGFANCTKLQKLFIPDSITEINGNIFSGCYNLTDVTFSDSTES